jgi:hypothetical protein
MRRCHGRKALLTTVLAVAALAVPDTASATSANWTVTGEDAQATTNAVITDGTVRIADRAVGAAGPAGARNGRRTALVTQPVRHLAQNTNALAVTTDADTPPGTVAATDVRGQRPDGTWTEWLPPKGNTVVLPVRTSTVQTRIVLIAAPNTPSPAVRAAHWAQRPAVAQSRAQATETGSVYATREGLVGHATANGHVITDRDHFVALPSRRALSGAGNGDYSVRVCAGERCEWAPVWDVGPWNTADNYWDAAGDRESFGDLPQGKPEAQAAYEDGYHGGTDESGRAVSNPAGIDLADGTFYDGLGLTDNAWVQVGYSWTGTGPSATIDAPTATVPVRSTPRSNGNDVGDAADSAQVRVECRAAGDRVDGPRGASADWLRLGEAYYVSAAFVIDASAVPDC